LFPLLAVSPSLRTQRDLHSFPTRRSSDLDGRLKSYEELVERSTVLQGDGFVIQVASLDDIIEAKERANRPKDREGLPELRAIREDRKSTRLNSSHVSISYAVFCLKKKTNI